MTPTQRLAESRYYCGVLVLLKGIKNGVEWNVNVTRSFQYSVQHLLGFFFLFLLNRMTNFQRFSQPGR